jgi:FtsZ-binding cell division protein ZapB
MDLKAIESLVLRLAATAEDLDSRSLHAMQNMENSSQQMRQTSQEWARHAQQLSHAVVHTIRSQSHVAVSEGTGQALRECNEQVHQLVNEAARTVHALQSEQAALRAQSRSALWVGSMAVVVGSLIAAGGSTYVVWERQQALQQVRFSEEILQATHEGRLTVCGKHLCARVGNSPQRYGAQREFALIR